MTIRCLFCLSIGTALSRYEHSMPFRHTPGVTEASVLTLGEAGDLLLLLHHADVDLRRGRLVLMWRAGA